MFGHPVKKRWRRAVRPRAIEVIHEKPVVFVNQQGPVLGRNLDRRVVAEVPLVKFNGRLGQHDARPDSLSFRLKRVKKAHTEDNILVHVQVAGSYAASDKEPFMSEANL
jgi:hypothetical protein